jgi:hypothetical protein
VDHHDSVPNVVLTVRHGVVLLISEQFVVGPVVDGLSVDHSDVEPLHSVHSIGSQVIVKQVLGLRARP